MSDEIKKSKTKKKVNAVKAQLIGLYASIAIIAFFWGGFYYGTHATLTQQASEANVKVQAVEAYKESLTSK
jgi:hypothetical protein